MRGHPTLAPFLPSVGQIFEWYRHCHRLWNLADSTHQKIEFLKSLKISEKQKLVETEKQFRQIIDEMNESLQAIGYNYFSKKILTFCHFLFIIIFTVFCSFIFGPLTIFVAYLGII